MSERPQLNEIDPNFLNPNPWNPNVVPPDNEARLRASIERLGFFLPVVVRELANGELEILDGEHRVAGAKALGLDTIPVINLGEVDDARAKSITLAANERYGSDDSMQLAALYEELGAAELKTILPISDADLAAIMSVSTIDLDELGIDEDDDETPVPSSKSTPTHRVLRFKVALEDAERLSSLIKATQKAQGLTKSDELTNAGDALVHLLLEPEGDDAEA